MPPKRACDVCYKRKIQCTIPNPDDPCEWCSHHDLACTFARETQKKSNNIPAIANDVQELFRRVADLENALSQTRSQQQMSSEVSLSSIASTTPPAVSIQGATPSSLAEQSTPETLPSSHTSPPADPDASISLPRDIRHIARYLGQNWYHKGIPILSERGQDWILSKTGQRACFDKFHLFGSKPSLPSVLLTEISHQQLHELPEWHIVQSIIDAFFSSSFRLVYPILDRVLFEETLTAAYSTPERGPLSHIQLSAKACVLAAMSMMTRLKRSNDLTHSVRGGMCAYKAQTLLTLIAWKASLESLQTVLMLQIYRTSTGEWEDAVTLHSIACRMVCSLGGHFYQATKYYAPSVSSVERQSWHTRILFWLSYIFDKDISLRSGQPPLLTEEYCDLTPPESYTNRYDCQSGLSQDYNSENCTSDGLTPYFLGDLGLSYIKEKTCHLLYSPTAFKVDDTQLLLHIRHLDTELESWRASIPMGYRPKLSIPPGCLIFDAAMSSWQRMKCFHLQLEYHCLMTAIHTTVRRCGAVYAEAPNLPDDLHSVFHSSSDLSLEASRSTLALLKSHINVLEDEVFWRVAFYPFVAAMSLFMNILIHPLDPQVQIDLEILASTISIFQNVPVQALTSDETEYIKEMNNFVTELVRLGNCALWKARREEKEETGQPASRS